MYYFCTCYNPLFTIYHYINVLHEHSHQLMKMKHFVLFFFLYMFIWICIVFKSILYCPVLPRFLLSLLLYYLFFVLSHLSLFFFLIYFINKFTVYGVDLMYMSVLVIYSLYNCIWIYFNFTSFKCTAVHSITCNDILVLTWRVFSKNSQSMSTDCLQSEWMLSRGSYHRGFLPNGVYGGQLFIECERHLSINQKNTEST